MFKHNFPMISLRASVNIRHFCMGSCNMLSMVGRSYLEPISLSSNEIKSLIWTAFDLKQLFIKDCCQADHIQGANVTLLMQTPNVEIQASSTSAASLLKANLNTIIDPAWDESKYTEDIGNFLSTCSDMIFCQSKYQSKIEKLQEGSAIPVVTVKSSQYATLDALADMMTLQERYGSLKDLNLGWVGKPSPLMNAYLCIAPKLGIHIKYCCACKPGLGMSPATLPLGKEISEQKRTVIKECESPSSAIHKVHAIAVSKEAKKFSLNAKQIMQKADKHWCLLHPLPSRTAEAKEKVFNEENFLVWEAKSNLQWIYAALMLRLLAPYEHVNKMPEFDQSVKCCSEKSDISLNE